MKDYDGNRLVRLFDKRWAFLGDWRNRWEEFSQYIMPQQRTFTSHVNAGNERQSRIIFDSTALEANERLATRLHEALTSPSSPWFSLGFKDEDLNKIDAAKEWLEECEVRIRRALRESNFDIAMGQFNLDLGCLGSAVLTADEKESKYTQEDVFNGLNFTNIHLEGIGVGQNAEREIDQVFWRFEYTADQCVQRWGDKAPKQAIDLVNEHNPDTILKMMVCMFPRHLEQKPTETTLLPKERPWARVYVNHSTKEMVEDGGTYEKAVFVGRWRLKSEDPMGYGPGERALPTIRTVNEAERLELAAWAKVIDPPILSESNNVVGDVNIRSAGITNVRDITKIRTWDIRPDINHHLIQLEDKRFQIRDIFKYHQLELPPREQVGAMTAYEVARRSEQIYRALGPTMTQLQSDVLNPLLQRVFGIMLRKNALPEIPEVLIQAGASLEINYIGPMALAQRATEVEAMDRFLLDSINLAEMFPKALDVIDIDGMQRHKAELLGVPAVALRGQDDVDAIREERVALAEEQRDLDTAVQESQVASNLGQGLGPERAAEIMEHAGGNVEPIRGG